MSFRLIQYYLAILTLGKQINWKTILYLFNFFSTKYAKKYQITSIILFVP